MLSIGVDFNVATGVLDLTGTPLVDPVSVVGRSSYVDIFVGGYFQARIRNANSTNVSTINFDGKGDADSLCVQNIRPVGTLTIGLTDVESLAVIKGRAASVTSNGALRLGTSSFSGALSVTTGGALTQSGSVSVAGLTTLVVNGGDVALTHAGNNFSTVDLDVDANVSLRDVNSIVLAASEVSGNLKVEANLNSTSRTAVSQTGPLEVDGTTVLTVGSASTITLSNAGNRFTGAVSITAANATLANSIATDLGSSNVTRNLTVRAAGAITQSGPLTVGRVASLSAAAGDITLTDDSNNFATVSVTATTVAGQNVSLVDSDSLVLDTSSISGTLELTADGAITQKGAVRVTGATTLTVGEVNDVILTKSTNDFASVAVVSARHVALGDSGAIDLAASTVSGTLGVTARGAITDSGTLEVAGTTTLAAGSTNQITLDDAGNNFSEIGVTSGRNVTLNDVDELILAQSRISGTLTVQTGGSLTQSGQVLVAGLTTLIVDSGDIVLEHALNNFSIVDVSADAVAGQNVSLRDTNAVVLAASEVLGDFTVQANLNSSNRVALSQTGSLTVAGATTLAVGPASTITLANAANAFAGAVSIAGRNATLVNSAASGTILGPSILSGNLTVTDLADSIGQAGPLVVGKVASLSAAANIDLTDPDNNFQTVAADAVDVSLSDVDALIFGACNITGNLAVTAEGSITQSGALRVAGPAALAAGEANDIVLLNAANDFSSVGIGSARNVSLRDGNDLDLAASTISGTLAVTTDGAITDSGAVEVAGKATLAAGDANDITLDEAGNNFSEIGVTSGNNVALVNSEALILAASKISGNLAVTTSDDALTQSGALVVAGTTALDTGVGDIELTSAGNNFATLTVTAGGNVSIRDINAVELGASAVSGALGVTAGGGITQSGPLAVTGAATFATNASASVTLDDAGNDFSEVAVTSGHNVSLADANALVLGASNVSGPLAVSAGGDVSQSGPLVVGGAMTLDVTAANSIDLSDAANDFGTLTVTAAANVGLRTVGSLVLAALDLAGDLRVECGGAITDSGDVLVDGDTTLVAGDDITLDTATSEYAGRLSLEGVEVSVTNNSAAGTLLGQCTAIANLTVFSTGGDMTNSPDGGATIYTLSVVGTAKLDAGANALTLYTAGSAVGAWDLNGTPVIVVP